MGFLTVISGARSPEPIFRRLDMTADQIRSLQPVLAALLLRFRGCFKTEKTFGHWQKYLPGLMADLKRRSIDYAGARFLTRTHRRWIPIPWERIPTALGGRGDF